jgi:hypothetical protein
MAGSQEIQQLVDRGRDEWADRKDAIKARFSDVSRKEAAMDSLGVSLIGLGIGTVVRNLVGGRRTTTGYVVGALVAVAGVLLLGMGSLERRTTHISQAEEVVRDQLASLDPVARAQILKDMADEQVASVKAQVAPAQ